MLAVNTDYARGTGDPEPPLRGIAEAGFTHVHWCHQWCTDFIYTEPEIRQVELWFAELGLKLVDLHASHGVEKCWADLRDYRRQAGLDLVRNRIEMTQRLEGDVITLHAPSESEDAATRTASRDAIRRSLDELSPHAERCGVRIAFENLMSHGNADQLALIFSEYPPDYVGLCYDSGHGNVTGDGLDLLEKWQHRLIAVHLHDNDGTGDQHQLPYQGSIDWSR
ncbi:MAG: sugar phosphate isomerase/epimerase, partial [Lentisphaerae bacterium]|nr:sugar phosphate isomerase/epimerase [Lentisphaerota bacterium]